jgi:hypothetical protein
MQYAKAARNQRSRELFGSLVTVPPGSAGSRPVLSCRIGSLFVKQRRGFRETFLNCHSEQSEESRSENQGPTRFLVACGSSE